MLDGAAVYAVRLIDHPNKRVWIIDQCDVMPLVYPPPPSVTNDAERVCRRLYSRFGNYRYYYRDTMGNWDELVHDRGHFTRFAPARELAAHEGPVVSRSTR